MAKEHQLTKEEWTAWALLGDPHAMIPATLRLLADRIKAAIDGYAKGIKDQQISRGRDRDARAAAEKAYHRFKSRPSSVSDK